MTDVQPGEGPYSPAWRRYRRWARAFWIVALSYLPGVALIDRMVRSTHGNAANTVTFYVALAWLVATLVTGYCKGNFTCPRCGESYFAIWLQGRWRQGVWSNIFARRCLHCGLPKWAPDNPRE